jgi:hypothetical protein
MGVKMKVLGRYWGFLTIYLDDRVILCIMDVLGRPQGSYPKIFVLISLFEVFQEWESKKGGNWRTFRFPDWRLEGQGHHWCQVWSCLTLRKRPWKFCIDIFIRSVSGMGGQEWGYLEDVEGSWLETWRTGSSIMLWMIYFDPKEDTLHLMCWYLY